MTLEEKACLCSGLNFWNTKGIEHLSIPSILITDGPHGIRKQLGDADHVGLHESIPTTCFPTASALAATWNRDLIHQVGVAIAEECRQEKVSVILGPGVNIKRSPLCGRNFEYYSEDPYLTGELAKSYINGIQCQGIGTSLKHYTANNQEYRRMVIDTIVDERALREIYLTGYEIAVKQAQPWTVMCSYNKINGTYASDHKKLMNDILKVEWGHDGLVITDWGAMNDRVEALKAGTDLEMPGSPNGNNDSIVAAVQSGELDEQVLNCAVERILTLIVKAQKALSEDYLYDSQAHHDLARQAAGEGIVLLQNEGNILPLRENAKIALIGAFAKYPRYQGAGSSLVNPTQLDNLYDEIIKLVGKDNLTYSPGYTNQGDQVDRNLIKEAVSLAKSAEYVVICAGLTDMYEVEGLDRTHMKLPAGHDALIKALAQANPNVVVVLSNGSPVEIPWVSDVAGILESYLGGQAGAGAVADILFGKVNPSGKLAETFPIQLEDNPSYHYFPGGPATVEYRESIYVGYRYYDTVGQDVLFPFGHGLSYTTFEYSDLQLSQEQIHDNDSLSVSMKIKNTGKVPGKEIIQLYIHTVEPTVFRPTKELKGFTKVQLHPTEEKQITFELNKRSFAYYNTDLKDWHVEPGWYEIIVAASSRDFRLKKRIEVLSSQAVTPEVVRQKLAAYYDFPKGTPISKKDFEALLGRPVPSRQRSKKGNYDLNTPVSDMTDSLFARGLYFLMKSKFSNMIAGQEGTPTALVMEAFFREMPMRSMLMSSGNPLTREMLQSLLMMINGKFFKGFVSLIKAILYK
jgi:beta-glucosidase